MVDEAGRYIFEKAHERWQRSDLDGFLALMHDDIVHLVNVDGIEVPYASSAVGKEDLRWRLQHLLDTFHVAEFAIEDLSRGEDHWRSVVRGAYAHKVTGELLAVRLRFRAWIDDGLIVRMEEQHDAAYVKAFERFVQYLMAAGGGPSPVE